MVNTENNTTVTVELGGRLWSLKLGHRALQQFSAVSKVPMSRFGEALDRYDLLIVLLWSMLWVEDHTVSRAQLDDWLDAADLMTVFGAVSDAAAAAFPQRDDEDTEEDPLAAAGTGEQA